MPRTVAGFALAILIPMLVFAKTKEKETINVQVVSSKTAIHSSGAHNVFTYTEFLYTLIDGKKVMFACDQKGDICPLMESGKTYAGEREGDEVTFVMSAPEVKKPFPVKYKEIGSW